MQSISIHKVDSFLLVLCEEVLQLSEVKRPFFLGGRKTNFSSSLAIDAKNVVFLTSLNVNF